MPRKRTIFRPVVGLAGEEDLLAARGHDFADECLADAVEFPPLPGRVPRASVGRRGIDVVDAQVNCPIDDRDRHIVLVGLFERRLAAEAEQARQVAGAAEWAPGHRQRRLADVGCERQSRCANRSEFHELPTSQVFGHWTPPVGQTG
jgi:hypothetical protein